MAVAVYILSVDFCDPCDRSVSSTRSSPPIAEPVPVANDSRPSLTPKAPVVFLQYLSNSKNKMNLPTDLI